MKYAWIAKHKAVWPVTLACEVLEVSASGYSEHWRRKDTDKPSKPGANKRNSNEALLVHIRRLAPRATRKCRAGRKVAMRRNRG